MACLGWGDGSGQGGGPVRVPGRALDVRGEPRAALEGERASREPPGVHRQGPPQAGDHRVLQVLFGLQHQEAGGQKVMSGTTGRSRRAGNGNKARMSTRKNGVARCS
eukprot:909158-Prorocentrum_minimum.AAC.1